MEVVIVAAALLLAAALPAAELWLHVSGHLQTTGRVPPTRMV
jgi:hypothetical protein